MSHFTCSSSDIISQLLSCSPGKWLMPITGRGGSLTTHTGSFVKTLASSTWKMQWTCGSTWINASALSLLWLQRLSPMHNKALKRNKREHPCGMDHTQRDGPAAHVEGPRLQHSRPSIETSHQDHLHCACCQSNNGAILCIFFPWAPLTYEYILALRKKRNPFSITQFRSLWWIRFPTAFWFRFIEVDHLINYCTACLENSF